MEARLARLADLASWVEGMVTCLIRQRRGSLPLPPISGRHFAGTTAEMFSPWSISGPLWPSASAPNPCPTLTAPVAPSATGFRHESTAWFAQWQQEGGVIPAQPPSAFPLTWSLFPAAWTDASRCPRSTVRGQGSGVRGQFTPVLPTHRAASVASVGLAGTGTFAMSATQSTERIQVRPHVDSPKSEKSLDFGRNASDTTGVGCDA